MTERTLDDSSFEFFGVVTGPNNKDDNVFHFITPSGLFDVLASGVAFEADAELLGQQPGWGSQKVWR
eukprot:3258522-Pyramimonas_sp.AAC.1